MKTRWQVGDHIEGRWEIFKILQGGAGVVYVVYDHIFRESFAAKTFHDDIFITNPQIADRFEREAMAWVKLDVHPNIAQARMVEQIEGKPYLFLEYVSGGDLGSWIGTPALTEDLPQVLRFAIHFCDGMIHAFSKGIRVHRDIKPRNCLITKDGVLKVTDFGLAKLFDNDSSVIGVVRGGPNLSLTVTTMGTCTHMAPEQFANTGNVDLPADIYSFGVMLFQMISGELPFNGENWGDLEEMHKTRLAPLLGSTDRQLAELIQMCMAKDPGRRPANFRQVRALLSPIYQKIVGSPPAEPVHGTALTAVQWNNKGSSLDNLGLRAEAIACFDSAIKLNPLFEPAWFNKGVALLGSDRAVDALSCCEHALMLNAKSEKLWSNKGVALKSLGKTNDAIACYDRAIKINPRYANAWVNKGVALRTQNKTEEALVCYDRALVLNPKDENGWTNKGNILYSLRRNDEALVCYDRALELNTKLDRAWMNRGIALNALGRHGEAMDSYGKAIELNSSLDQAWFLMGLTLVNVFHSYREALPYLEEAERLGSKLASQPLAMCQTALGRN